jgi:hypothetical protein
MATTANYPTENLNRKISNKIEGFSDIPALCIIYYYMGNQF